MVDVNAQRGDQLAGVVRIIEQTGTHSDIRLSCVRLSFRRSRFALAFLVRYNASRLYGPLSISGSHLT